MRALAATTNKCCHLGNDQQMLPAPCYCQHQQRDRMQGQALFLLIHIITTLSSNNAPTIPASFLSLRSISSATAPPWLKPATTTRSLAMPSEASAAIRESMCLCVHGCVVSSQMCADRLLQPNPLQGR